MGVKGTHAGWARSSDVCEGGWVGFMKLLRLWDPLALYVCPSWIHGQRTKEAVLLHRCKQLPGCHLDKYALLVLSLPTNFGL